jgi:aspartyl-tRNA(Asn)/glutamyl-tRNA(Gln) amidotransferase subunit A
MDEFAMGSSNENSGYGPVLNPWDKTRVPGGSSGGSAAAVAAGLAPWAIGTDTGGSIRQPASLCGIVGLKPTYGAVSRYGMIAFASSLDQAGPLARDVTDTALLLGAMVGADPCDSTSIGLPEPVELPTKRTLEGIRLGVPEELTGEGIEPGVLAAFHDTLEKAKQLGATVETTHLPHAPHGLAAYYLIAPYVGFIPTIPHSAAGWRIEPPVSVPSESGAWYAATTTADPPLEPPGTVSRSHGFETGP